MIVRREPARLSHLRLLRLRLSQLSLGLVLSLTALTTVTPGAAAGDGRPAEDAQMSHRSSPAKDTNRCSGDSRTRLRVVSDENGVLLATGMVWTDGKSRWAWRFKHNSDLSARGVTKANPGKRAAIRVRRSMVNLIGPDHFVFRAKNLADGEVCRVDVFY